MQNPMCIFFFCIFAFIYSIRARTGQCSRVDSSEQCSGVESPERCSRVVKQERSSLCGNPGINSRMETVERSSQVGRVERGREGRKERAVQQKSTGREGRPKWVAFFCIFALYISYAPGPHNKANLCCRTTEKMGHRNRKKSNCGFIN